MKALEENVVIEEDGCLDLTDLPVKAGDRVKVILLLPDSSGEQQRYPLRGASPYRFDDPTSPVAPEDWGAAQ